MRREEVRCLARLVAEESVLAYYSEFFPGMVHAGEEAPMWTPQPVENDYAPPSGHCAHRPQTPTADYAPPPQTAEVRVDAVENDEVIAHALQEELAQVAMAEAEGGGASSCSAHAVLAQQWIQPEFVSHLPSAPPYVEEEQEAEGHSREQFSSCSSPEDGNNADGGQGCSIELVDDFSAIDGEVGKRLNGMVPVPYMCSL